MIQFVPLLFTKMQGGGNDFIIVDCLGGTLIPFTDEALSKVAEKVCHRKFGVGADQLLLLKKPISSLGHVFMQIFNTDGLQTQMCGNGVRSIALYYYQHYPSNICGMSGQS